MPASKSAIFMDMIGDRQLKAKLERLRQGQERIARKALKGMMKAVATTQKSYAPMQVKSSIGFRFGKASKHEAMGKVGINVGKTRHGRFNRRTGVMVKGSQQNQLAFILTLGTTRRWTGQLSRKVNGHRKVVLTGHNRRYTGMIKPQRFLKPATQAALPNAIRIGERIAWETMLKEGL